MTDNPNELTVENSAVVLIDHQPWVAFAIESLDRSVLINNVTGLARAAKNLGVPTVLTTVGAHESVLVDPHLQPDQRGLFRGHADRPHDHRRVV